MANYGCNFLFVCKVSAKDPVHFDSKTSVGVGPALSFVQTLVESNVLPENKSIGLVPVAIENSSIADWRNFYFEEVYTYIHFAMKFGKITGYYFLK